MGYSAMQRHELEETINRVPCDLVLVATPIDLARMIQIDKPSVRVSYEVEELTQPGVTQILENFTSKHKPDSRRRHDESARILCRSGTSRRNRSDIPACWRHRSRPIPAGVHASAEGQDAGHDL